MIHNLPKTFCVKESDFSFLYIDGTDSGGFGFKNIVDQVVKRTGSKKFYNHAHEWCCGHGAMGFTLLHNGTCNKLTLSDIDFSSMMSCQFTSAANNIKNKVSTYLIEEFSDIPMPDQPWDLIVTNPPYAPDLNFYEKENAKIQDRLKDMWVDPEWKAHKNFFANLKKYIDNECDIYMFGITPYIDQQISLAELHGFKLVQIYDDLKLPCFETVELLHFRP